MEKPKYVISPIDRKRGIANITKGKEYELLIDTDPFSSENSFEIFGDDGTRMFCLFKRCAHILNNDWIMP